MISLKILEYHKKSRLPLLIFILNSFSMFSAKAQSGIEGKWKNEDGVVISIYEEEGKYFGQLISSEDTEQNKRIQENDKIVLLKDFEKKDDTEFCCGTIFQPRTKRTLNATLFLEDAKTLKMKARYGFFSGTKYWERL